MATSAEPIMDRGGDGAAPRHLPPDVAVCDACLGEVLDPADRRYRYPFTSCACCGPRAAIIDELPYRRAATTMRSFPMCDECAEEYADPAGRRFHAEAIACPTCGPRLAFRRSDASTPSACADYALTAAVASLRSGRLVAVRGLGGYHVACDATDERAVARLRERDRPGATPLAVLVADLAAAERLARISPDQRSLLAGPERPVVLATARPGCTTAPHGAARLDGTTRGTDSVLAASITGGGTELSLLLPATPLQHLLLAGVGRPLVLLPVEVADEPMVPADDDAAQRLALIADAYLLHDRPRPRWSPPHG